MRLCPLLAEGSPPATRINGSQANLMILGPRPLAGLPMRAPLA